MFCQILPYGSKMSQIKKIKRIKLDIMICLYIFLIWPILEARAELGKIFIFWGWIEVKKNCFSNFSTFIRNTDVSQCESGFITYMKEAYFSEFYEGNAICKSYLAWKEVISIDSQWPEFQKKFQKITVSPFNLWDIQWLKNKKFSYK